VRNDLVLALSFSCRYHLLFSWRQEHLIEDLERGSHGRLDVQNLDVLPVLLEKRDQEVDSELYVEGDITRGHGDVGNSQRHAHNLLHLELDGGLGGIDLLLQVVVLIKKSREFAGLGETRTKDTRNLLDERGRGQKVVVLLGELLDKLLVLVELLEVINGHLVHTHLVGLLAMLLVTQNANGGVGTRDDGQTEGAGETFVSLGVIVLQGDLKFNGLGEFAHLSLDISTLDGDGLPFGKL
jgi:hypothetical protein